MCVAIKSTYQMHELENFQAVLKQSANYHAIAKNGNGFGKTVC